MNANKTQAMSTSVSEFLDRVPDPKRREDACSLCELMERVTGEKATMWGPSIIGFGSYHYRYDSGREGDAPVAGFSPRAKELVVYLYCYGEWSEPLLAPLGKHKAGKACLYIKSLADVDQDVLAELIARSAKAVRERYSS